MNFPFCCLLYPPLWPPCFFLCFGLRFQSDVDSHLKVLEEAAVKMQCAFPGGVWPLSDTLLAQIPSPSSRRVPRPGTGPGKFGWQEGERVGEACKAVREGERPEERIWRHNYPCKIFKRVRHHFPWDAQSICRINRNRSPALFGTLGQAIAD